MTAYVRPRRRERSKPAASAGGVFHGLRAAVENGLSIGAPDAFEAKRKWLEEVIQPSVSLVIQRRRSVTGAERMDRTIVVRATASSLKLSIPPSAQIVRVPSRPGALDEHQLDVHQLRVVPAEPRALSAGSRRASAGLKGAAENLAMTRPGAQIASCRCRAGSRR